jgi:CRISPR/Cas system CSM-associated protein Csm3 (group 7 of RAMP superfamily)
MERLMNDYQNLARLNDLEVRLYRLETKSHLRIGAGEGSADISAAENPIIRALIYRDSQAVRIPYIPGSSLHGVTRAWVEKALRSQQYPMAVEQVRELLNENPELAGEIKKEMAAFLGKEDANRVTEADLTRYWPIYPHVCNPLLLADQCERISRRDLPTRQWKLDYFAAIGREIPCEVCNIFGFVGQRGRVKVSNAFPAYPLGDKLPVDVITRVAINRLTGAADEGKLFDLEAIPPGVSFYFFVVMENMSDTQKQTFEKGIRAMNLQLAGLGAHSTIGFGMVDINLEYAAMIQPTIFDLSLEDRLPEILKNNAYRLRAPLDKEKYPDFFLALSTVHKQSNQPPVNLFGQHVTFR